MLPQYTKGHGLSLLIVALQREGLQPELESKLGINEMYVYTMRRSLPFIHIWGPWLGASSGGRAKRMDDQFRPIPTILYYTLGRPSISSVHCPPQKWSRDLPWIQAQDPTPPSQAPRKQHLAAPLITESLNPDRPRLVTNSYLSLPGAPVAPFYPKA